MQQCLWQRHPHPAASVRHWLPCCATHPILMACRSMHLPLAICNKFLLLDRKTGRPAKVLSFHWPVLLLVPYQNACSLLLNSLLAWLCRCILDIPQRQGIASQPPATPFWISSISGLLPSIAAPRISSRPSTINGHHCSRQRGAADQSEGGVHDQPLFRSSTFEAAQKRSA